MLESMKSRIERVKSAGLTICQPLADALLSGLETRFASAYEDSECLLAAVSDPM